MLLEMFDLEKCKRIRIGVIGYQYFEDIEKGKDTRIVVDESGIYVLRYKSDKVSEVTFYPLNCIDKVIVEYE